MIKINDSDQKLLGFNFWKLPKRVFLKVIQLSVIFYQIFLLISGTFFKNRYISSYRNEIALNVVININCRSETMKMWHNCFNSDRLLDNEHTDFN